MNMLTKVLVMVFFGTTDGVHFNDPFAVMQGTGWDDLYKIFQAFISGIYNIVTNFFAILWTPLKGLADTISVWFQGLQQLLSRTWGGVPMWFGVVVVIIVFGVIWAIIKEMKGEVEQWIPSPPKW